MPFQVELAAVHILLALLLFFTMNWIGGHAVITASYYQITYFSRYDDAPAFNVVFRVLAPVVFIIITGALLYTFRLPQYVEAFYRVVIYQQLLRWVYLVLLGRRHLVQWRTQILLAAATWLLSYLAYRQIIIDPKRLLPDFGNLTNELWLVILVFLYKLFDNVYAPVEGNADRKELYLRHRYEDLAAKFGGLICTEVPRSKLYPFIYAVLIYETFNRPAFLRMLERVLPGRGLRSYGPMQVQSDVQLSDYDSVKLGCRRLVADYEAAWMRLEELYGGDAINYDRHQTAVRQAAAKHNIRSDYPDEVLSIHNFLADKFYPQHAAETTGLG